MSEYTPKLFSSVALCCCHKGLESTSISPYLFLFYWTAVTDTASPANLALTNGMSAGFGGFTSSTGASAETDTASPANLALTSGTLAGAGGVG